MLRRPIGGRAVHIAQLDALPVAAECPGVAIQVIPLATGAHAGLTCTFTILSFKDGPDVAYTEDRELGHFHDKPELVRAWFDTYEALRVVTSAASGPRGPGGRSSSATATPTSSPTCSCTPGGAIGCWE